MGKFPLTLLFLMTITLTIPAKAFSLEECKQPYGPEIYGIQLCMPTSAYREAAKEIDKTCDGCASSTSAHADRKYINNFMLSAKLFGLRDLHNEKFLQGFIDHYHIPRIEPSRSKDGQPVYIYKNTEEGYQVSIYKYLVELSRIEKAGNQTPIFK